MSNDLSRRSAGAKADRDHILEQALKQVQTDIKSNGKTEKKSAKSSG